MEKLLRYLNIYAHSFMNCNLTFTYDGNRIRVQWDEIWPYVAESIILNKKFWFIKWLVENDKIDLWTRDPLFITELAGEQEKQMPYSFYEEMLIRLALSDTPIEDLISYLK